VQQLRGYAADLPKHIRVALPALSPTMEMGTIVRHGGYLKKTIFSSQFSNSCQIFNSGNVALVFVLGTNICFYDKHGEIVDGKILSEYTVFFFNSFALKYLEKIPSS
jgi:hypothetical protein